MTEKRSALLVASYRYQDRDLSQLIAPAEDAAALARVLGDPAIGGFDVQTVINEPSHVVARSVEEFFADRHRDDLLLFYFTGHGLKDEQGRLFFAMANTERRYLGATSLPAAFVNDVMDQSRSRRNVLLLDCCYSGAFAVGRSAKGDPAIHTPERFRSKGRVVLTASDALQFSFEGDRVAGRPVQSIFTRILVQGITTGEADRDGDGQVDLDELYAYVDDRMRDEMPQQRPGKWQWDVQGSIVIARNPKPKGGAGLPQELREALASPYARIRHGAMAEVGELLSSEDQMVVAAAEAALRSLVEDNNRLVSQAATEMLTKRDIEAVTASNAQAEATRAAVERAPAKPEAEERASRETAAAGAAAAQRPVQNPPDTEAREVPDASAIQEKHERRELQHEAAIEPESADRYRAQEVNRTLYGGGTGRSKQFRPPPSPRKPPRDRSVPQTPRSTNDARPQWIVGISFLLVIILAVGYLVLKGPGGRVSNDGSTGAIKNGGTINFAADLEPTGFNVNTSKDNGTSVYNITTNIFPNVFRVHPDYSVKLDKRLMESVELIKENPQTVVYKIKKNAIWSDGTPVSADDFIYLWKNSNGSIETNDVASTTGYDQIKSVTGSDKGKTVTMVYSSPFADWQSLFTQILPAHYLQEQNGGWNTGLDKNPQNIPSAGPFVVENYTPRQSLTLQRNDKYYGPKAHLDHIVYRFPPELTTPADALQNNEVDLIYPQPQLDQIQQVQALSHVQSQINFGLTFEHLDFNFRNEHLAELKVRQAIATALDREALLNRTVRQFSDEATVLGNRIWLTGQKHYQDHSGSYGKGDVAGAERLLEDAGYTKGSDGIYAKGGKKLSLRYSTTAGNRLRETQGELFQTQMQQAGIDIKITNVDSIKLFGDWLPKGNFDITNFAWLGTPFAISSNQPIYQCGSSSNYGNYCNTKVDDLFKQAVASLNPRESSEIGNRIDQRLWDDLVTIPLYQKPTFIAYRKEIVGITDNGSYEGPFWNAADWGLKA